MKSDLDQLQGTWNVATLEVDGAAMPTGAGQIVIKGDRFKSLGMGATYSGKIKIDSKKKPKTLDMIFTSGPEKGNTNLGIFEFDLDGWRLCLNMHGKARPKKFATKPGSGIALETLRRAGKSAKSKAKPSPPVKLEPAPELEGEWAMLSCIANGEALDKSFVQNGRRVAQGNNITISMSGHTVMKAKFTVDRSKTPMAVDYILSNGQGQHGIYELNGPHLKVSFTAPGQERPPDFSASRGDGRTITEWQRIK